MVSTVIVRIAEPAWARALRAVRDPSVMLVAAPLAIQCGTTLILPILGWSAGHNDGPGPIVTVRRAWRRPDFATAQAVRAAYAARRASRAEVELLLIDGTTLWGVFWSSDGDAAEQIHVRVLSTFEFTTLAPDPVRLPSGPPLPRTTPLLGERGAAAWREICVAILGAGRTGTHVALALAAQGVRRITLVDGDVLSAGNVDGTVLVRTASVGSKKVCVVAKQLVSAYPDLAVHAVPDMFPNEKTLAAVTLADVVVTCVDQDASRLHGNYLARRLCQVHVDIATSTDRSGNSGADVRVLLPTDSCLLCAGAVASDLVAAQEQRLPGRSSWYINSVASATAGQALIAAISGRRNRSRWIRLSGSSDGSVQCDERRIRTTRPRCPWCNTNTDNELEAVSQRERH